MNKINIATLENILLLSQKNQTALLKLLQALADNCPENISALQQAFSQRNKDVAQQLLHKIRGSFATFGADQLAQACAALEQNIQRNILPTQIEQNSFYTLYQESCQALQQYIQQQASSQPSSVADTDLHRLLQLLEQQNLAATALASAGAEQLKQLLPVTEVTEFYQQLAKLNYSAAAVLLRSHLTVKCHSQRKGD